MEVWVWFLTGVVSFSVAMELCRFPDSHLLCHYDGVYHPPFVRVYRR